MERDTPVNGMAANDLGFFKDGAGTPKLLLQYSSGNVGIGTTSPGAALDVAGHVRGYVFFGTGVRVTTSNKTNIEQTGSSVGSALGVIGGANAASYLSLQSSSGVGTSDYINFLVGNNGATEAMRITTTGNVGIGTTGPVAKLEVMGSNLTFPATSGSTQAGGLRLRFSVSGGGTGVLDMGATGSSGNWLQSTRSDDLSINYALLLNPNGGNVGIGTTAPGARLQVVGSDSLNTSFSANLSGATGTGLVVTNSGNIGIGTTSPGATLHLYRASEVGLKLDSSIYSPYIGFAKAGTDKWEIIMERDTPVNGMAANDLGFFKDGAGTPKLLLQYSSGNVGIGTTNPGYKLQVFTGTANGYVNTDGTWGSSSDINLKKNIFPIPSILNNILALNPVSYDFKTEKDGTISHIGFIAQEVEKLFPELVSTGPDGIKGISYAMFTPLLTKAIQQQQTQITGITENQNKIVNQLTGQLADQSLSVDSKLQLIGQNLDNIQTQLIASLQEQITTQTSDITELKDQIKTLQDQTKSVIDFQLAFNLDKVIIKDALGNISLLDGKITAKDIEVLNKIKATDIEATNSIKGDNIELGNNSRGQAMIAIGEKEVIINSTFVNKNSQIYLTSKKGFEKIYYDDADIKLGESFKVKIDDAVDHVIYFNWLIVK
jgi:TolA-binding protein